MSMAEHIVILGAGPTGLGAACRLAELGHTNWEIYERSDHVGRAKRAGHAAMRATRKSSPFAHRGIVSARLPARPSSISAPS